MSNKLVNMVDKARVGDATAKSVLRKIADQSNDFGSGVWSSHEHIAWCLEITRQTVATKCAWLKDEHDLLTWETRPGTSNLYSVNVDKLETMAGVSVDDTLDDGVSAKQTGVSAETTPDVGETDSSHVLSPVLSQEPTVMVTDTAGNTIDEHLICEHCKSAPKKSKRKNTKWCVECTDLGDCARCGEVKIERHPKKRRDLCSTCGEFIDDLFDGYAYLTFKKRSKMRLDWQQVEAIHDTIGEDREKLFSWGAWLDHWKASGWFMGKNAMGKILQGWKDNGQEFTAKNVSEQVTGKGSYDPNHRLPPRPTEE